MKPQQNLAGRAQGHGRAGRLFSLDVPAHTPLGRVTSRFSPLLERVLSLDAINSVYDRVSTGNPEGFLDRVLDDLGISYRVNDADLARIPANGPLVVVANHPFGAVEGIILTQLLRRVRPDVRFMANFILGRIPELKDLFICVDNFGDEKSTSFNLRPMRQSLRWLRDGGALAVFPAGEVAHLDLKHRGVVEPHWSETIARLVRHSGAPVLPVYFEGNNGPLFHLLGMVHPKLRTAMLPRQLMNKSGQTLDVRIGAVIPSRRLTAIEGDAEMTDYLRQRMLLLRHRDNTPKKTIEKAPSTNSVGTMEPIVPAAHPAVITAEVTNLPPGQLIVDGADYRVYVASAKQAPTVLREIGRLREISYRASGEGTGKAIDLDDFDQWYQHLFMWDVSKKQIIGAYRLGPTDKIIAAHGPRGLYTSTLFDFKPALLARLTPALELGRAFVRAEYQKSYAPLLMLWKGIARFVCLNPWYKILFGPVSISNDYQFFSRHLMVQFLRSNHPAPELVQLARAKNPFPLETRAQQRQFQPGPEDIDDVVSDLEPDGKGVPVLLRQYLKLGARFFSFNVDAGFGDAIDALMFVDLTQTNEKILDRYMGREAGADFRAYHRPRSGNEVAAQLNRN
jgi:putative hemolysin